MLHTGPHMAVLGGLAPGLLSSTVGGGGTGWADGALLGQQVTRAHEAVEQLVGCKELRSPVVSRMVWPDTPGRSMPLTCMKPAALCFRQGHERGSRQVQHKGFCTMDGSAL
jgi:hypothetical protein